MNNQRSLVCFIHVEEVYNSVQWLFHVRGLSQPSLIYSFYLHLQLHFISHHQREKFIQLFNELLTSLANDLFDVKESIHDVQIQTLFDQTKLQLEKFKNTLLTKTLNMDEFYSIFLEFTKHLEGAYSIMQTIFKHVTIKTNKVIEENKKLSDGMDDIKNKLNQYEQLQEQIEELQKNDLQRLKKEKYHEKRILIRDLFILPREKLCQQLQQNNISDEKINIFVELTMDSNALSQSNSAFHNVLETVSKDFGLTSDQMIFYLKEKKKSNESFHLDMDLKTYAKSREISKTYILNEFIATLNMHSLDAQDSVLLQPVFEEVCRIINKQ